MTAVRFGITGSNEAGRDLQSRPVFLDDPPKPATGTKRCGRDTNPNKCFFGIQNVSFIGSRR